MQAPAAMPLLRRPDDHHRDFRPLDAAQGAAEYPKSTRKDRIVTRRQLIQIPAATALLRRCQHIAASGPQGRQKIDKTQQRGEQGEQNPRQPRNELIPQTRSGVHKDASQTSQNTKSP